MYGKDYIDFPVRINPEDIEELEGMHKITCLPELSEKRYGKYSDYGIWFGIKNEDRKLGLGFYLDGQEDLTFLQEPQKFESKALRERKNGILQSNMAFYFKRIEGTQYVPDYHFPPKDPKEHEDVFKEFRAQLDAVEASIRNGKFYEEIKKAEQIKAEREKIKIFTCDTCHYIFYADKSPDSCPNCKEERIQPVAEIKEAFEAGEENAKRKVFPISTVREAMPDEVKIYHAVQSVEKTKKVKK